MVGETDMELVAVQEELPAGLLPTRRRPAQTRLRERAAGEGEGGSGGSTGGAENGNGTVPLLCAISAASPPVPTPPRYPPPLAGIRPVVAGRGQLLLLGEHGAQHDARVGEVGGDGDGGATGGSAGDTAGGAWVGRRAVARVLPIDAALLRPRNSGAEAVGPAASAARTTGEVAAAGAWVLAQSGLPNPVTRPAMSKLRNKTKSKSQSSSSLPCASFWGQRERASMSNMSLMAKVRPCRGSCCDDGDCGGGGGGSSTNLSLGGYRFDHRSPPPVSCYSHAAKRSKKKKRKTKGEREG